MPPLNDFSKTMLALALSQALVFSANAASIIVNSSSDIDANDSNCTLREAIVSANTNAASTASG